LSLVPTIVGFVIVVKTRYTKSVMTLPSMGIDGKTIFKSVMSDRLLDYARLEW
jgi:hypothetical protein